jgi:hypothetical protein
VNENLRRAFFRARLTEDDVAARLAVDPKTVRRWLEGRVPYPRNRWDLAQLLEIDEAELWPEIAAARATHPRPAEMAAVYPHRSSVSGDAWRTLFAAARREIAILAYSGLFLAEDPDIMNLLVTKARARVTVRIALGDPASRSVAERGRQEQIDEAMAAKIRNALVLYRPLRAISSVQFRLHSTVLYNSIYRSDDELLVNQHAYGVPAARAPVYHLRATDSGDMFQCYLTSFDRVWADAVPIESPDTATSRDV